MARRIADRQKDGLVFRARLLKRGLAPGIPIHGIVRVLLQVRTLLADQMIRQLCSRVSCLSTVACRAARIVLTTGRGHPSNGFSDKQDQNCRRGGPMRKSLTRILSIWIVCVAVL